MKLGERLHLTYCSNIHPGESWPQVAEALATSLPRVRALLGFEGPFAIGLRLSADAARSLESPDMLARFREFLDAGDYYVPTINGFPYGAFHGTRVKERVYLPDWRTTERVEYTNGLARLLAVLAADRDDVDASISTVPGGFRAHVQSTADIEAVAAGILSHAAFLKRLRNDTGVTISLALEPEPACQLETVDDVLVFFSEYLFAARYIAKASYAAEIDLSAEDVARHVGVCLDACHMAVEFEDPAEALERLRAAGIRICKAQLSSALRLVRRPGAASPHSILGGFAEDTYLHQVVVSDERGLTRYTDLPQALGEVAESPRDMGDEWRVHFHVPIFLASMSGFDTTQSYLTSMIHVLDRTSACGCLEVETYTWDVLPPEYRTTDVCSAIARELAWVRATLGR